MLESRVVDGDIADIVVWAMSCEPRGGAMGGTTSKLMICCWLVRDDDVSLHKATNGASRGCWGF